MADTGKIRGGRTSMRECPDETDLLRFDHLELNPREVDLLADHFAECPRCAAILEREAGDETRLLASMLTPGELLVMERECFAAEEALLESFEQVASHALEIAEASTFTAAWSDASRPPSTIGPYQILHEIGRGGMGIVYRARHVNLKRDAAVKVLPPALTARPAAVERFYREMESLGQLQDPHIVHAYDAGEWEGVHFLAMEFVDGVDVSRLSRSIGPLSIADACEIICQAAAGLETARRHHLVHRDIKPSNLIVTRDGRVKILDLGLAAMRAGRDQGTGQEAAVGTVDYMAPEQWKCDPAMDIRADIYSLGCTLFTLLTGRPPFARAPDGGVSKMQAHLHSPPPRLVDECDSVPDTLSEVVSHMLSKSPSDRPYRPSELIAALEPYCRDSNLAALVDRALAKTQDTQVGRGFTRTLVSAPRANGLKRNPRNRVRWLLVGAACLIPVVLFSIYFRDRGAGRNRSADAEAKVSNSAEAGKSASSLTEIEPLATLTGHGDAICAVDISADGREILTSSQDRTVGLWDVASASLRRQFFGHTDGVWCVAFRPGTRQAASGSKDGTVRLWDLDTGAELHRFEGHTAEVASVAFSRDGTRMLTASFDRTVRLWNVETRQHETTLSGHLAWVRDARFLPDERYAFSCDNATLGVLWNLETGRIQQIYVGHNTVLSSVDISADGKFAATSSWDEMIRLWEIDRGRGVQILHRNMQPVRQVAFISDTYYLLSASEDRKVRLWNPFSASVLAVFSGHEEMVRDVVCDAKAGVIVTASEDRTAKIWPLPPLNDPPRPLQLPALPDFAAEAAAQGIEAEHPFREWQASPKMLRTIAARPDGAQIATGGDDGSVRIWSVSAGELVRELSGPEDGVLSVAYSHRGDRLAASAKDGNVYVWDLATDEPPRTLVAHTGWVTSVMFRHDDAELLSCGFDGSVCAWKIPDGELHQQIKVSSTWLHHVHYWSDDEKTLAVCYGMDDNPRAADLMEGELAGQFGTTAFGHILACGEISPDAGMLAAGGWRSTVQLWDIDGQAFNELQGHYGTIYDLHWEPDSRYVITASVDGTLRRWDVSEQREVRRFIGSAGGLRAWASLNEAEIIVAVGDTGKVMLFRNASGKAIPPADNGG